MKGNEAKAIATVDEAVAYDATRPETATRSRVVNLVVEAIPHVRGASCRALARRFGVTERALAGAVEFDTGMRFEDFVEAWRVGMVRRMKLGHEKVKGDAAAHLLGFSGRTALWLFMERKGLKRKRKGLQKSEREAEVAMVRNWISEWETQRD